MTHPDDRVRELLASRFTPLRMNLLERDPHFRDLIGRTPVPWAPTVLVLDPRPEGKSREVRRTTGYLGPDDYLAELELALGLHGLLKNDLPGAGRDLARAAERAATHAAPEALFWAGVVRFLAGGRDMEALAEVWEDLLARYPETPWADRARPIEDRHLGDEAFAALFGGGVP